MKKRNVGGSILAAMSLLLLFGPASADSLKTGSLEQKIYEISVLRAAMLDKIDQAIEVRTRLEQRLAELRDEIWVEQSRFEIHSYQQALQNLRIRYNLNLIGVLRAYANRLNERIDFFQTANERMRFMVQQINDDIAVINTLEDMQIEELINHIDQLLHEFIPEAKKQVFDAGEILPVSAEHIWNEINTKQAEMDALRSRQS